MEALYSRLPEGFKVGSAVGGRDGFFDSVAKGLRKLRPSTKDITVKSLREMCGSFAQDHLDDNESRFVETLNSETEKNSEHIAHIKLSEDDFTRGTESVNVSGLTSPLRGRGEIEERIICKKYNVKLHVLREYISTEGATWLDQMIDAEGSRYVRRADVDYNAGDTVHLARRDDYHFMPIIPSCKKSQKKRRGKQGLHGEIYQLKVLMLFLKRGLDNGYPFRLCTEKKEAKKFDDLFFEITNENCEKEYRLLQIKHKDDDSKKIEFGDLLTEDDGPYSLVKYFFSYQDCKEEQLFKNGKIKDITLFTNIDVDLKDTYDTYTIEDIVDKIGDTDGILDMSADDSSKEGVRYRFKKELLSLLLKPKLENYNLTRLARRLAKCFLANSCIRHHQDIFKDFQGVLAKEVIDVKERKFRETFLKNEGISEKTIQFRRLFAEEIKNQTKGTLMLDRIDSTETLDDKPIGLNVSRHFGKGGSEDWPEDTVSDESISDFLNRLIFAVNQPNERQLGEIIKSEMGKDCVYNEIFVKMLDWLNGKGEEFISLEDGKMFFEEARRKLSELELSGLTREYESIIKRLGIEFSSNAIDQSGLSDFLTCTDRQIFNITTEHTALTAIKVHQVLRDRSEERYMFMRLDSVLRHRDTVVGAFKRESDLLAIECISDEDNVQELFNQLYDIIESENDKKVILIIEHGNALTEKLKTTFGNIHKCDENNCLTDLTDMSQETLLNERRLTFQGERVTVGTLIDEELKHLIHGELLSKLINNEIMEIDRTQYEFGDIEYYYIDRKINRRVTIKDEFFKEQYTRDLFVISDIEPNKLAALINGQSGPDRRNPKTFIALDNNEDAREYVNRLYRNYSDHNVHWLKRADDCCVWQCSHGALSSLRKFVDTKLDEIKLDEITDIAGRIVIVSAEAGMGKSTVLTKLKRNAKKSDPSQWIVRINLIDHSTELNEIESFDERGAIEFLYRAVGFRLFEEEDDQKAQEDILSRINIEDKKISLKGASEKIASLKLLEIAIFNHMYNRGRVTLLFDGFDEISPDYTETVINLLQVLKDTNVTKIWITTRPYDIQNELENSLSEFSYSLKPLVEDEQKRFLLLFWQKNLKLEELDERRSAVFIDHLLRTFSRSSSDRERKFFGIPLQMRMLAEIFQGVFEKFYESDELHLSNEHKRELRDLNLVKLYETFIFKKFYEIRFGEKEPDINVNRLNMKRLLQTEYTKFIKNHRILALYGLFKEDCLNELLSERQRREVNTLVQLIRQADEKTGIINQIIDDRPNFIHRAFAEYFAADWLALNREKQEVKSFLRNKLFGDGNQVLRSFFDRILIRDDAGHSTYEIHTAVLNNDERIILEMLSDPQKAKRIDDLDKGGRTPLHLASAYGYSVTTDTLLRYGADVNTKDAIFGWTPLAYADKSCHWDVAEKLLQKGARGDDMLVAIERATNVDDENNTLLHTAARMGYTKFAKLLIETGNANVNAGNDEDVTPLHQAARSGDVDMVKLLIGNHADFTSKASGHRYSGYMPIHFAAQDGRRDSVAIIKFLVDTKNAEFDTYDHYGTTPLLLAAENGHLDIVKYLIEKGADVVKRVNGKFCDFESGSILHLIASNCRRRCKFQTRDLSEVLQIVIKKGVSINLADNRNGNTPLHLVTEGKANFYNRSQTLKFAETFIRNGADVNVKNKQGQTPRDLLKYIIGNNADKFLPDYAELLSLVNLSQSDIRENERLDN